MSNFAFMKTGFPSFEDENNKHLEEFIETAQLLIGLFMSKAITIGSRYCVLANRTMLLKEDIEYALKYQAIEFFETTDLAKELNEIRPKIMALLQDDNDDAYDDNEDAYSDNENAYGDNGDNRNDSNNYLSSDDENDEEDIPFTKADPNFIKDHDDCLFVNKMHHYYDHWDQWKPENYFENKIKEAIDQTIL